MGHGSYSHEEYENISNGRDYSHKTGKQILNSSMDASNSSHSFNAKARTYNKEIPEAMLKIGVRESRDSEEHPNTTPIIIATDVTGSMYRILADILREHLPQIMKDILDKGVPDPQLLFAAFGDHYSDRYPFQMGQFESDTEKILNSIQSLYPEEGGGGNGGESPSLIWLGAGYHTETDSWFKRGKKGFLFTISDEPCHENLEEKALCRILHYEKGVGDKTAKEVLAKAREQYEVYHLHMDDGSYSWREVSANWKELLGERALHCQSSELASVIVPIILRHVEAPATAAPAEEAPVAEPATGDSSDFFF